MSRIYTLPETIANRIAAGEVAAAKLGELGIAIMEPGK
jgi:hypothetical protein